MLRAWVMCVVATLWAPQAQAQPKTPTSVLHLDEAVATTLRLLPALQASNAAAAAARARIIQARAPYLPSLNASLNYARQTANFVLRPGILPSSLTGSAANARSLGASFNYWTFQLQVNQLLFDFGATAYALSATRSSAKQSEAGVVQAILEATLATRSAYFAAQGKQGLLAVAQETLANQQRHRQQIRGQVQVGQRPPIDLAQADTDVSQARVTLITAQNDVAVAHAALMQAMGVEGTDAPYQVANDSLDPVPNEQDPVHLLSAEAIAARPEMQSLNHAVRAQRAKLKALYAGLAPQIGATGQFTDAGQNPERLAWNWAAGVTLNWPLLAGGQSFGQIQEAQALLRQAQAQANTARNTIHMEVTQARLNVQAALLVAVAAQDAAASAHNKLHLAEGRYATGLGSVIELSDAQLVWASARSQQVVAGVDIATARASLIKALGRLS